MGDLKPINPVLYERLDIYLLKKYVDDCLVGTGGLRLGSRWCPNQRAVIWSRQQEKVDRVTGKDEEQVTMEVVSQMAGIILDFLNFTYDCPSLHPEGSAMPVLDIHPES